MGASTPINGTGTVTKCTFSGGATLSPPLRTSNASVKTTIRVTLACTGGTGNGAKVTGGSVLATETCTQNCSSLGTSGAHHFASTITWKVKVGTPALNPSKGTLTKFAPAVNGQQVTVDVAGENTSGSFAKSPNNDVALHGVVKQTVNQLLSACASPSGLTTITFKPTSTFTVN